MEFHRSSFNPAYPHFKLSPHLVMCDWSGKVGKLVLVEGERRDREVCSQCRQEVKYIGPEKNVARNNPPEHLGSDDRIELYYQRNTGAVINYYHPLKSEFRDRDKAAS